MADIFKTKTARINNSNSKFPRWNTTVGSLHRTPLHGKGGLDRVRDVEYRLRHQPRVADFGSPTCSARRGISARAAASTPVTGAPTKSPPLPMCSSTTSSARVRRIGRRRSGGEAPRARACPEASPVEPRQARGHAGVEASGLDAFLEQIRHALVTRTYRPMRLRHQAMPKEGGKGVRVLSIPDNP